MGRMAPMGHEKQNEINQEGVAAGVFLSQNDQQDEARPTQSNIEQQINLFVYVCHVWSFLVFLVIVGIDVRTQII